MMMDGLRPPTSPPQRVPSPYWTTAGDNLVLDVHRHCQVDPGRMSPMFGLNARGLSTLDATLSSLREDQQRLGFSTNVPGAARVSSRDLGGNGGFQHRNVAELSARRRDAIKSAFRRIDPGARGWASVQEAAGGLQRYSMLAQAEQAQILMALLGGQTGGSPMKTGRITFTAFAGYYQHLSGSIERDREFEDLLRCHWGFTEVSDILDDMKNKFAMVGLAYAFRHSLERGGSPQMTPQAFQEAISHVGMQYGADEIQRLFDAFDASQSLEILRFIQHLTSAPRPPTPIADPFPGVGQPCDFLPPQASGMLPMGQQPPKIGFPQSAPDMSLNALQNAGYPLNGAPATGKVRLPDTVSAPPEGGHLAPAGAVPGKLPAPQCAPPEIHEELLLPPHAPPEKAHELHSDMPKPPKEDHPKVALPPPVNAPPEAVHPREIFSLEEATYMPRGVRVDDLEPQVAPPEEDTPSSYSGAAPGSSKPGAYGYGQQKPSQPSYNYGGQAAQVPKPSQSGSKWGDPAPQAQKPSQPSYKWGDPAPQASPAKPSQPSYKWGDQALQAAAGAYGGGSQQAYPGPDDKPPARPPNKYGNATAYQQQPAPSPSSYGAPQQQSPTKPAYQAAQPAPAPAPPPSAGPPPTTPAGVDPTQPVALAQKGRNRAVTVGINYIGQQCQLEGCINDSDTFISLLTEDFGYDVADIRQLRDDHPQRMPTRKNIAAALKWLVNGAREGDHLFFHYSGHGSQQQDADGDEMDGQDDTLVPCDYQSAGMLTDDELRQTLVTGLPKGCRLTCVFDCCHSGTALDLPYKVVMQEGSADIKMKPEGKQSATAAGDIVMLSGCMDNQTSADAGQGLAGNTSAAGAMTTAFKLVISKKPSVDYHTLLVEMRRFLKDNNFTQIPQLTSEHFLNLDECFMPEAQPPDQGPPPAARPPVRKALTIGINYLTLREGQGRLAGCINDSETMVGILKDTFGFQDSEIRRLRDDRANMMPTKANMLAAFKWLTGGASSGDELFLHYSGHGGQQKDTDGDEESGKDDTLIPCDFQTAGQITDDELHSLIVAPLPKGVRMWVMLDCCHSGTALDLPYKVTMAADGKGLSITKGVQRDSAPASQADVIMISGCQDTQTSADVQAGSMGVQRAAGAMTTAFRNCVTPDISCMKLLTSMRDFLKKNKFEQVPQMSSELFIQLDAPFVVYLASGKQSRDISARLTTPATQKKPAPPTTVKPAGSPMRPTQQVLGGSPMQVRPQQVPQVMQLQQPMYPGQVAAMTPVGMEDMVLDTRIHKLEAQIAELRRTTGSPMRGAAPPGFPTSPQGGGMLPQQMAYAPAPYAYNQYA